jgi:hypothetical protein
MRTASQRLDIQRYRWHLKGADMNSLRRRSVQSVNKQSDTVHMNALPLTCSCRRCGRSSCGRSGPRHGMRAQSADPAQRQQCDGDYLM